MSKKEKLVIVRQNKGTLTKVIEKKGYSENIDLDSKKTIPSEEYSSKLLWDLIKTRADLV